MFKLLIVVLFFLEIKSESENNFMENLLSEESEFDKRHTEKVYSPINKKDKSVFADLVTHSKSHILIGKIRESNQKLLEGNKNQEFSLFRKNINELEKENGIKISDQLGREQLLQVKGIERLYSQGDQGTNTLLINKFTDLGNIGKKPSLKVMQTIGAFKSRNSHRNDNLIGNAVKGKTENPNVNSQYQSDFTKAVNEAPFNFLKNKFEGGNYEDESNKNFDNYDISKYKSDSRNGCLPNVNRMYTKNDPQILFDREQDDGPHVTLLYSLINLKTLRPKTKITFAENGFEKKITTQDQCKCLKKTYTSKQSVYNRGATLKMCNTTVTRETKDKNNETKTHSNKAGHTKCMIIKTSCIPIQDRHSKSPYTPLFTILPRPELNRTRNLCLSTKLTPKINLAFTSSSSPSILNSLRTSPLPVTTQNTTQSKIRTENKFHAAPSPFSLSSSGLTDRHANTVTPSDAQSSGTGDSLFPHGSDIVSSISITKDSMKLSADSLTTLPLVSTEVAGGGNTYSGQESTVASGKTSIDQTKVSVTQSTLITDLLSRGNITNPPFRSLNKDSTKESSMDSSGYIVISSSPLPELKNDNQVQSTKTSPGTLSVNVMTTQPFSGQNQNRNKSQNPKSEVSATTCSIYRPSSGGVERDSNMKRIGQDERNDLCFGLPLQPTVTEDKKYSKETLSLDDRIMSFSPPPPFVFSHEPEFIATLFNDVTGGMTECLDISRNKGSNTKEQSEPEPSHLKDLFASPETITLAATNQTQPQIVSESVSPKTGVSEQNKPTLLGYLKSFTSSNSMDTYSNGPMNAYFSDSKDLNAVNNCLGDFSRMFSRLETKTCE